VPAGKYRAVVFDLFTALLDSWSLWNEVAGTEPLGLAWRTRYLVLTYEAGAYRPYEGVIRASARDAGVPPERADALIRRWGDVKPWPETREVVSALMEKVPVAVATNASIALARVAVGALGVPIPIVVTAEEAGFYKPRPEPYRMALQRLGCSPKSVLFVAGSAADVPGASAVGMPVFWHNRRRLPPVAGGVQPLCISDSLQPLLDLV
jgi:2-haloalkanoic acid dehalogenase type II